MDIERSLLSLRNMGKVYMRSQGKYELIGHHNLGPFVLEIIKKLYCILPEEQKLYGVRTRVIREQVLKNFMYSHVKDTLLNGILHFLEECGVIYFSTNDQVKPV
eukprot:TRINITY_DN1399_c0_g1_i5.p2 TRINITY_DN1399_c0_g1~~TRINITY_DN1399_c0_g1_i5.p2  ORF type:complete len:104 (+),score=17.22 TRINITY_DN1399_c0_g1_i5:771-1082(+)